MTDECPVCGGVKGVNLDCEECVYRVTPSKLAEARALRREETARGVNLLANAPVPIPWRKP